MRARVWTALSLLSLVLLAGCGGQQGNPGGEGGTTTGAGSGDLKAKKSLKEFGVKPLSPGTPCALISAQQAGELGIVSARSDQFGFPRGGRPQTPTTCFWANSEGVGLDLQVHEDKDGKAVSSALGFGPTPELIKGYPASALTFTHKSCSVEVALSDRFYLRFQVNSNLPEGGCALGRRAAEVALANAPQA